MKTVLFAMNGSHAHASLSVRCLKRALEGAGYEATVLEATLRDRTSHVLQRLYRENADIYGFSCYIWNITAMLSLARDLKALLPRVTVVLGGPEVSYDTERFASLDFVSTVITGEGEEAMVQLVSMLAAGEIPPRCMEGRPYAAFTERGIAYGTGCDLAPLVYYESSRGCPFSCAFCLSSATAGVRAKSAEDTLSDLLEFEKYPWPLTVKLVDRTFNFDRERAKAIWRGLLSPSYTKCYHFEVSAALLDDESLSILSRFPAGKLRLEIGLQSTNKKTLAAVSRHTDAERVLSAARRLVAAGNVHVHLDLIAGLPHEDMASMEKSFNAAFPACHVLQLGFLKLLHGTKMRERAAEWGMIYSEEPPYTVLATAWLTFEDMMLLHGVADLLERMHESGKFPHTLPYITEKLTPFAFFRDFYRYLETNDGRALQKLSQRELFTQLANFGTFVLPQSLVADYLSLLRADHASFEVRRPPAALFPKGDTRT